MCYIKKGLRNYATLWFYLILYLFDTNGNKTEKGDGLSISDETSLEFEALNDAELLIIEVPGKENAR